MRLVAVGRDFKTASGVKQWFDNNQPFYINEPTGSQITIGRKVVLYDGLIVRKYSLLEWRIPWVTLRFNGLRREVDVEVATRSYIEKEMADTISRIWSREKHKERAGR